jgi:hypothetical protein
MQRVEQQINAYLDRWPAARRFVKDAYQRAWSLLPGQAPTPEPSMSVFEGYFVGFHDVCPFSDDDTQLLVHRVEREDKRTPAVGDITTVGVLDVAHGTPFRPLARTAAFNWQEGSRAQWLGRNIIYNEFGPDRTLRARILDQSGATVGTLARAISAVHATKHLAAGYDFARLMNYDPAYSYAGSRAAISSERPLQDGLWLTDLECDKPMLVASLGELADLHPIPSMSRAYHYVSHCQFSPAAEHLSFMHCWMTRGLRHSRLATYELATGKTTIPGELGWVSHHCWHDESTIIAYASAPGARRGYYRLDVRSGRATPLGKGTPVQDGHPQISPDGRSMVTDTYPDRRMRQDLILYDLESDCSKKLTSVRIPWSYRYSVRCDFHPRWNHTGNLICFDSPHTGRRAVCTLPVQPPSEPRSRC